MSATTPRIWTEAWGDQAYLDRPGVERIALDTAAWFAWLAAPTTTSFAYPVFDASCGYIVGVMTVRKERRQRGGCYWSAYRRQSGRLRKVYLGPTAAVTRTRLDAVARSFTTNQALPPPLHPHRNPPDSGEGGASASTAREQPEDVIGALGQPSLDATRSHPHIMDAGVRGATVAGPRSSPRAKTDRPTRAQTTNT
jgi:hypothetical protein